jgi:Holliday junction DNA helicase RuvB
VTRRPSSLNPGGRGDDDAHDDDAHDDERDAAPGEVFGGGGRRELLGAAANDEEVVLEADDRVGLRPRSLAEFVGQTELKARLTVMLGAARQRRQPADHMLFAGPPGLGKTTLATIVAHELGAELHVTTGPALERPGDLASILANLQHGDVLFVDEIHRLARTVEEVLYPAMEDFHVDLVMGKGPAARTLRMALERFTLVGATTRTGLITGPLRDRFGLTERLDYYTPTDLESIVVRAAQILEVSIDIAGAAEIARRSRGTPRIANRLLRQVRDYAQMHADGHIDADVANKGLAFFGVDELGLDRPTRAIIEKLCRQFDGGPVGLSTLAIAVSEPTETVEDVYEPFLIQQGLLIRTPRGRVATSLAWKHLGMVAPRADEAPPGLFD